MVTTLDTPLLPGHRATLDLWADSDQALAQHHAGRCLAEAAAHAVLATLRECVAPASLFHLYHDRAETAANFARIASLTAPRGEHDPPAEGRAALHVIREAAFHLRWRELCHGRR